MYHLHASGSHNLPTNGVITERNLQMFGTVKRNTFI